MKKFNLNKLNLNHKFSLKFNPNHLDLGNNNKFKDNKDNKSKNNR